jgi:hypothetical protein
MNTSDIVDHINGDTFDNRKFNLRIVSQHRNMFNIRKDKFVGVKKMPYAKVSYQAMIMKDYKPIYLGTYPTFEEAAIARLKSERELFGEYGGQKDLYYILDHPNPIVELQKALNIC